LKCKIEICVQQIVILHKYILTSGLKTKVVLPDAALVEGVVADDVDPLHVASQHLHALLRKNAFSFFNPKSDGLLKKSQSTQGHGDYFYTTMFSI
jgi:hypothetical protein